MTKAFDNIMAGLEGALAYAEGDASKGKVREIEVVDVRAVRGKTGLSQAKFAAVFCVPLGTLRNWEQGRRQPDGPATTLLHIINNDPKGTLRALHG